MLTSAEQKKLANLKIVPSSQVAPPKPSLIGRSDVEALIAHLRHQGWTSFTARDICNYLVALGRIQYRSTWAATIGSILDDMKLEIIRPKSGKVGILYRIPA